MHTIYVIRNKLNDKCYVGQAKNLLKRWARHRNLCKMVTNETYKYKRFIQAVHYAMAKYGIENFEFKAIDEVETQQEANTKEAYWANKYNSYAPYGYNVTKCGMARSLSEETKQKISKANKGKLAGSNHPNWGKKRGQHIVEKIANSNRGKIMSEETRQKVQHTWIQKGERLSPETEFQGGQIPWNKGTKGVMKPPPHAFQKGHIPKHKISEEIRKKIRQDPRSSRAIAKDYDIDKSTVLRIKKETTNRPIC